MQIHPISLEKPTLVMIGSLFVWTATFLVSGVSLGCDCVCFHQNSNSVEHSKMTIAQRLTLELSINSQE